MNMLDVPKYTVNTRAWYGRLRGFLFSKGFEMGSSIRLLFSSGRVRIS
jgi:CRISPR/Cas system-associated protein endoribonuclease Cas2